MSAKAQGKAVKAVRMPVLFIGHGSPQNVTLKNDFTESLSELGKDLPRPQAVMVVSAHWLTGGKTSVGCVKKPTTIHDFYGFPEELYKFRYPCPGEPSLARYAGRLVKKTEVECDPTRGLDHASWAVLKHIYPEADVPVFEMSLDYYFNEWKPKPLEYHYELAAELKGLRKKGVLIIGSGNVVHNLGMMDPGDMDAKPYGWALEFDEEVKNNLLGGNHEALLNYRAMGGAELSVPTLDHYLPLIYAAALREEDDPLRFIYEGFQYSSVSMRCFQIGISD